MIKRRRSLSAKHGGKVKKIDTGNGKMRLMKTYCRFFQTKPSKCSMICAGYLYYPSCPDFNTCWRARENCRDVARTDSSAEGVPKMVDTRIH